MSKIKKILGLCSYPGCFRRGNGKLEIFKGTKNIGCEHICSLHHEMVLSCMQMMKLCIISKSITKADRFDAADEFRKAVQE